MSESFVFSKITPINSIINPDTQEKDYLDRMAPFSFFNFLKNVNANLSPLQLNDLYVDYIKQWSLKKNNTLEESNNVIQERYLSLLKDITLKYSTLDEKRFLSNIDFNDPCDLDIIIPFYSKKIREVCDFYSQKREKLKFKIEKNKIKGIPTSLEKSVYETITDVIFSDVLEVGTYQKLVDEKELLRDLNIEVEELYDLYTSYLDNNPNESYTTYDVKTELRKRLFSANLNAIDADIFINFDQAITNQLFENVRVFLTELGRIFTINYDLNSVNLNCKPDEKLYDLVSNNKPKAERLVTLKGDLIKKYIGCDFYYITTGSTITDVTSSILFKADNPSGNLLNRHFPTTATIEEESDLQSCRRIGLFFTPEKNSILYYSVPDKKYKIDESKLEANKLYIFPDPDRYGNTIGLSRVFDTEYPLIHIADYTRSVKNESCVSVEGDINSNPFSQDFYAYFSKNQLHNNLTTNEEGLKTNFSKLYDLGVLVKWGTDIYGNQYGLFKNKSKKNLVDKTLNVSLSVDICEDYDGGPISFFQNGPLPEAVLLGDPKWVHPNVYNSEYYYNIGIEGSVGKTVNEIITEVVIPSNWHVDTSTTDKGGTIHGTVSLADEGGGVLAANFTNSSYISYDAMSLGTSDFTIEAWTKLDGNEGPGRVFVFSTTNVSTTTVITLCLNQAHSVFSMNNYSFESIIGVYNGNPQSANVLRSLSNVNTIKNKWTHLAMTRVGNTLRMFINGVLQSNATLTLPDNTDYTFGRVDVGYLNGKLTGFRIVKDAVLYTSDFDVPTTLPTDIAGTELLLNFQATVAPTSIWYNDNSSTPNAVTLNGGIVQTDDGGGIKYATFNGTNSYLSLENSPDYDLPGDFTVEFFAKMNATGQQTFVINGAGASHLGVFCGWVIRRDNITGKIMFYRFDSNKKEEIYAFEQDMPADGSWHHIAASRANGVLRLFFDGTLSKEHNTTTQFNKINTTDPLKIGHGKYESGQEFYLNGSVVGLRIVKGTALYTQNFNLPTTLPTDIAGTELLLNFQATVAPTGDPIENEPEANPIIIANNLQDLFVVENYEGIMERGLNRNKSTFIPDFNNNYILSSLKYKDFDAGLITDTCDETFDFDTQTKFILNERLTTSFTVTSNKVEDDNQNFYDLNKSYGTMYVKDVVSGEVSTLLNSLSVQFQSKYEDDFSEILDFNIFNDFIWIRTKNNLILEKIQYDENKFVYSGTSNTSFNTGYIDGFIYNVSNPFIFENRDYCMVASLSVTNSESNNFYIIPTIYKIDYNTCNKTKITSILELSSYQNDSNYNDIKLFRINQPILAYNSRNNLYCILATVEDENEFSYIYQIKFTYDGSKISNQEIKFYNFSGTEVFKTINFADKPGFSDNAILINDINSNAFKNFNNGILTFT